ncbi:MAG: SufD family Fe-S cluster assembly protein [Candidatus Peribacteraceae bacterium]
MVPLRRPRRLSAQVIRIAAGEKTREIKELVVKKAETKIVLGAGSSVTLFLTVPKRTRGKRSIDVTLGKAAELFLLLIQEQSAGLQIEERISVGAEASFHAFNVSLGGAEQTLVSHVKGVDGRSTIDWIARTSGREEASIAATNIFSSALGKGDITIRGTAEDHSRLRVTGRIDVEKRGGGTEARLDQNILLLDATAKADAVPILRIETDDVKAGHAASVTKVSPEDLFYLGTRGIKKAEARRMLIRGFLHALLIHVEDPGLRERVAAGLDRRD